MSSGGGNGSLLKSKTIKDRRMKRRLVLPQRPASQPAGFQFPRTDGQQRTAPEGGEEDRCRNKETGDKWELETKGKAKEAEAEMESNKRQTEEWIQRRGETR